MNRCFIGDCRDVMTDLVHQGVKVQMAVTSPPYWGLRDYGVPGQLGLERTPEDYVANMVFVFGFVRELLADDGTLWLNLGDSYAGSNMTGGTNSKEYGRREERMIPSRNTGTVPDGLKAKDLVGIPWRVAFALQADGWYLRQDIIWHKPNPMPESVRDRCTKSHEYLFLLAKNERYFLRPGDTVLDPFFGSGTTRRGRPAPRPTLDRNRIERCVCGASGKAYGTALEWS